MDYYEEIERYLEDAMSEEEEKIFLERMEHDLDLQEALKEAQAAYTAVDILHTDSIRKRLLEVDAEYVKKKASKRRPLWIFLAVATPILLFLALPPFFSSDSAENQLSNTDPDSASQANPLSKEERLFAYQTDICTREANQIRTRASNQNQEDPVAYTADDSVALEMCILLATGDSTQIKTAIDALVLEMLEGEEKRLRFSIYVGLLYMQLGDEEKAKTYFSQTSDDNGNHHVEADQMLHLLN